MYLSVGMKVSDCSKHSSKDAPGLLGGHLLASSLAKFGTIDELHGVIRSATWERSPIEHSDEVFVADLPESVELASKVC
jgi:hypothetical protein